MTRLNKQRLEYKGLNGSVVKDDVADLAQDYAKIRELIIAQLTAAIPTSLTADLILKGVRCEYSQFDNASVEKILRELIVDDFVIKISECGFEARYKLVDICFSKICETER